MHPEEILLARYTPKTMRLLPLLKHVQPQTQEAATGMLGMSNRVENRLMKLECPAVSPGSGQSHMDGSLEDEAIITALLDA